MTQMTGAEMVVQACIDHGVTDIFGYTGGAALPIYDAMRKQSNRIRHRRVRHEQGAVHMAEGYARSSHGKVGCVLVTSGPGATNTVTGLADALCDSIPLVVFTAQVATHLIGNDAFQECDTVGITRPCTKHNYLVKSVNDLARVLHEAFHIASSGRPGPVVVDIPKDVQLATGTYKPAEAVTTNYHPKMQGDAQKIRAAIELLAHAERPIVYSGGGIINSGPEASRLLREFIDLTGFPITSTLMGLGAFPASRQEWLGMLGMHGTYEANHAMHDCDVMLCIGARFDDRITGRLDAFSPGSRKIHVDIDPSSINKNVKVDIAIVGDCGSVLGDLVRGWSTSYPAAIAPWWNTIEGWRGRNCLAYRPSNGSIKPQHAIERLHALTENRDVYITTGVGQHQMWAAQYFKFEEPNRWLTSGGLGTMGYGMPAAIGVQVAHPNALVIDIDGDGSFEMTSQQLAVAVQYKLPIKVVILNNQHDGMVRQWQDFVHDGNRFESENDEAQPDYVKLAEAYGCTGIRCENPDEVDRCIHTMIETPGPVIFDCRIVREENCFPMIMSGKAHNDMLLGLAGETVAPDSAGQAMV